jgi:hypothetical protein
MMARKVRTDTPNSSSGRITQCSLDNFFILNANASHHTTFKTASFYDSGFRLDLVRPKIVMFILFMNAN